MWVLNKNKLNWMYSEYNVKLNWMWFENEILLISISLNEMNWMSSEYDVKSFFSNHLLFTLF